LVVAVILAAAVAVVYGGTFRNDWTYDDYYVVVANPALKSVTTLLQQAGSWRFVRDVSLFIDHAIWGAAPAGYHLQQLVLHWLNALLLWRFCCMVGASSLAALGASLLFIVHPVQVESIANISHRKESLALLFVLLLMLLYGAARQQVGPRRAALLAGAVAAFILAVQANETAVTAPLVLVVYEALFWQPGERILLRRPALLLATLAGCAIAGGFYLLNNFSLQEQIFKVYSKQAFFASPTYLPLFLGCLQVIARYAGILIWPFNLAPEYVIDFATSIWQPLALMGLLLVVGLLVLAYWLHRRAPIVSLGLLMAAILYLPIANFFPVAYMMADRYLYLPLAGLAIAVAGLLSAVQTKHWRVMGAVGVLVAGLSILSIRQSTVWRSEHTLWRHAVTVNPRSSWVHGAAAKSYLRTGDVAVAREHAELAIRIDRQNAGAYLTLARAEERMGNLPTAVEHYATFLSLGAREFPREAADVAAYLPYLHRRLERGY
jgi:tetratricopeptide (TPR) repeat protein